MPELLVVRVAILAQVRPSVEVWRSTVRTEAGTIATDRWTVWPHMIVDDDTPIDICAGPATVMTAVLTADATFQPGVRPDAVATSVAIAARSR